MVPTLNEPVSLLIVDDMAPIRDISGVAELALARGRAMGLPDGQLAGLR